MQPLDCRKGRCLMLCHSLFVATVSWHTDINFGDWEIKFIISVSIGGKPCPYQLQQSHLRLRGCGAGTRWAPRHELNNAERDARCSRPPPPAARELSVTTPLLPTDTGVGFQLDGWSTVSIRVLQLESGTFFSEGGICVVKHLARTFHGEMSEDARHWEVRLKR